eukprot:TRINITY_DN26453_c0_g1_i6.p3 TRINITY_DN26453_c0_g1~~TRINITY_DN26453_c0_g1_i6.p3  ORF type:complete len:127 (+),score=31.92 TRINITY_DN26453_c0_g1_i6:216-596(+)
MRGQAALLTVALLLALPWDSSSLHSPSISLHSQKAFADVARKNPAAAHLNGEAPVLTVSNSFGWQDGVLMNRSDASKVDLFKPPQVLRSVDMDLDGGFDLNISGLGVTGAETAADADGGGGSVGSG